MMHCISANFIMLSAVLISFFVSPLTDIIMLDGGGSVTYVSGGYENSRPEVKILSPEHEAIFSWNEQVQYEISVADKEDGESRFGEINANKVLLEIVYLPETEGIIAKEGLARQAPEGLSLISTSDCFSCHADKTGLIGPSFSEIAERYKPDQETIHSLGNHVIEGSSGTWGNTAMPPHPEISHEEAVQMATYILDQGSNEHRWIYPGLDGIFRIMEQPEDVSYGVYILTARYTDGGVDGDLQSRKSGRHSVLLEIK